MHRGETNTPETILCEPSAPANSSASEGDEGWPWTDPRTMRDYEYNGIELQRDIYAYDKGVKKQRRKKERRARKQQQQKKDAK